MTYKNKEDNDVGRKNRIFTYDLSTLDPKADSATIYQPTRMLHENLDEETQEKFEYEGISIFNNRKYVAMEQKLISKKAGYQDDAIVILSAVKN